MQQTVRWRNQLEFIPQLQALLFERPGLSCFLHPVKHSFHLISSHSSSIAIAESSQILTRILTSPLRLRPCLQLPQDFLTQKTPVSISKATRIKANRICPQCWQIELTGSDFSKGLFLPKVLISHCPSVQKPQGDP